MNLFYWPLKLKADDERDYEEIFDEHIKDASVKYNKFRSHYKANNAKFLIKMSRESLSDDYVFENFFDDIKICSQNGIKPSDVVYSFSNDFCKKTLSNKELKNLKKLDEMAKRIGVTVGMYDYKDVFSYKDVANADKKIKDYANRIKSKDFSPLEKLLNAYLITSSFKYKEYDKRKEHSSQSRSVYGTLNSDKIVCTGHSELLKAIVKELDDPNLKVFTNYVGTQLYKNAKLKQGPHSNNIVYVKDDKYKIDGFYYLDSTWDSLEYRLAYFMTEIGEIKNMYARIIDCNDGYRFYSNKPKEVKNVAKNLKSRNNFEHNYNYAEFASVSKDKVKFDDEIWYAGKIGKEFADDFLADYLFSRQDFKDYVILQQTIKDMKHIKEPFDKILEANAKAVDEDITQMPVLAEPKEMFKFLKQHSSHVDIGPVNDALHVVYKNINKNLSKDEVSKDVKEIIKLNVDLAKKRFNKGSVTTFTECEEL